MCVVSRDLITETAPKQSMWITGPHLWRWVQHLILLQVSDDSLVCPTTVEAGRLLKCPDCYINTAQEHQREEEEDLGRVHSLMGTARALTATEGL